MAQETDDGHDTVSWLRQQPWFDGRLATLGASYLGWTQWSMLQDPPPELRAAIVYVGPHDFREAVFGTGAFTLGDFLGWSNQMTEREDPSLPKALIRGAVARRALPPILAGLPLGDAAEPLLNGRAPWYRNWLAHPSGDDPWWTAYRAGSALEKVDAPVMLVGGWQDLFLQQTLEQYETLRDRGVDVALTVGPWTHAEILTKGAGIVARETLDWLETHLAGARSGRQSSVHVYRTGENAWYQIPDWPPNTRTTKTYAVLPDGRLGPKARAGETTFRYDPADPTPSVGGRVLMGSMGVVDNRALESRADVVTFSSDPLREPLDLAGRPAVTLSLTVDNPYADVFVRLCDVDAKGHSRNVSDRLIRLDPAIPAGRPQELEIELDPCFHRIVEGHQVRLQVSGGAFPRYARNLGTDSLPLDGRTLRPSTHTIDCQASSLRLPIG
jgi:putative CocE/NonD family hydrolase